MHSNEDPLGQPAPVPNDRTQFMPRPGGREPQAAPRA
ncbi:hypothetical protein PF70_06768, partial [Pseudomonas asplenii]